MKKIFLSMACLAFLAGCNNPETTESSVTETEMTAGTTEVDPENAAAFKFEKEAFDFGQITEGATVSHDFKFKNIGKSPLIITSARPPADVPYRSIPNNLLRRVKKASSRFCLTVPGSPGCRIK